jgi:predicted nuclease of predicted toxin-antitoxin system
LRFILDEQLPPRLADWLRKRDHDARHVLDIGLGGGTDAKVIAAAEERGAVLVTKNAGFRLPRRIAVPVIWLRFGNVSTRLLLERFAQAFDEVEKALATGEMLVEIE